MLQKSVHWCVKVNQNLDSSEITYKSESTNLGDAVGVVRNDIDWCYAGCQRMMSVKTTYTGLEEQETLIDIVFFVNPQNLEADYFLGFWTVELKNSLRFDKKYFGKSHFHS